MRENRQLKSKPLCTESVPKLSVFKIPSFPSLLSFYLIHHWHSATFASIPHCNQSIAQIEMQKWEVVLNLSCFMFCFYPRLIQLKYTNQSRKSFHSAQLELHCSVSHIRGSKRCREWTAKSFDNLNTLQQWNVILCNFLTCYTLVVYWVWRRWGGSNELGSLTFSVLLLR